MARLWGENGAHPRRYRERNTSRRRVIRHDIAFDFRDTAMIPLTRSE